MGQLLLIPDPRPLDQRLGRNFFRQVPRRTGVYVMRDAADRVLYVGKAKDIRRRLGNYRIANPDRMPRRHLRMVREVARVEFQFCPGESAALRHEAKLLRTLRPRFNRAGVWPGRTRFLAWRLAEPYLELAVTDVPESGWRRFGPLGARAGHLHRTLARLFWLAANPAHAWTELPAGWAQGRIGERVVIGCGAAAGEMAAALDIFFWDAPEAFVPWLEMRFANRTHAFERGVIDLELEALREFSTWICRERKPSRQLALL